MRDGVVSSSMLLNHLAVSIVNTKLTRGDQVQVKGRALAVRVSVLNRRSDYLLNYEEHRHLVSLSLTLAVYDHYA